MDGPTLLALLLLYSLAGFLIGALAQFDCVRWAAGVFIMAQVIAGGVDCGLWLRARRVNGGGR